MRSAFFSGVVAKAIGGVFVFTIGVTGAWGQAPVLTIRENGNLVELLYQGTHTIEASTNFKAGSWVVLGSQAAPFTDPNSGTLPMRFYRVHDSDGTFSANAVAYYQLTMCAGFSMVANQLNRSPNNKLETVVPNPPEGTTVYQYNPSTGGYIIKAFAEGAWAGSSHDLILDPSRGAFLSTPVAFTHRFFGEVQLNSSIPIVPGFNIISCAFPQRGALSDPQPDGLNLTPREGDCVFQWTCGGNSYQTSCYQEGAWSGDLGGNTSPQIKVGEAFWFLSSGGPARNWNRTGRVDVP